MDHHRLHDVTGTTHEPVPFPSLVADLEGQGCTVIGRLAATADRVELDPRLAEVFSPATIEAARADVERPPSVALTTSRHDAFAVVDSVEGEPIIWTRTLLADGSLVETVARPARRLSRADRLNPTTIDTLREAKNRSVRVTGDVSGAGVLEAHRVHVDNRRLVGDALPIEHREVATLIEISAWASEHDERVDAYVEDVMVRTPGRIRLASLVLALVVACLLLVGGGGSQVQAAVLGTALAGLGAIMANPVARALVSVPARRPAFQARLRREHQG